MIKVEITNFQSISHIELEFEGFATIVGRNFIGKSATLRAINAALTNKSGMDFIRHGENFCEVRIVTRDLEILWHKEQGNNFYELTKDGVKLPKFEKIGREEPPALIKDAGFSVIKLGSEKVNLNYAEQFFPLFLVDRTDTKGADLLTSVYGLDVLYKAVELCGKEQKSNKDDLRLRKKDLEFINKDLERFDGFDQTLEKGKQIKEKQQEVVQAQSDIEKLSQLESDMKRIYVECNKLKGISDVEVPDSGSIITEIDTLSTLKSKNSQYRDLTAIVDKLEPVSDLSIPVSSEIAEAIGNLEELKSKYLAYTDLNKKVNELSGLDSINLPEVLDLSQDISDIKSLKVFLKSIRELKSELERFKDLDEIKVPELEIDTDEISELVSKRDTLKTLGTELKEIESELADINSEQEKVEEELGSFDVCPLCGK